MNYRFKGTKSQYGNLHRWVRTKKGSPTSCEECTAKEKIEWANISGDYLKDISDYRALCRSCHRKFDKDSYRVLQPKTHCKNGHEYTSETTTRFGKAQYRQCLICYRKYKLEYYHKHKADALGAT